MTYGRTFRRTMIAKLDGTCPSCSGPIVAGKDKIDYSHRGPRSSAMHSDCSQAREDRETRAHDAACDARYQIAEGPIAHDNELPRERVAAWDYLPEHHCNGTIVERRGLGLYIGVATFLGYRWHPCSDVQAETPANRCSFCDVCEGPVAGGVCDVDASHVQRGDR